MLVKNLHSINADKILTAYQSLEKGIKWATSGHKGKQVGLQYAEGEDYWSSATGKHTGADEKLYSHINPYFKDTIFEEIIKEYNLFRTRLMWVEPFVCYSMHTDSTPRLHIPLITNPECYFVFKIGKIEHLAKDSVYIVDTRWPHTFVNCSEEKRLHLVGIVV
jgi:hypothetical protein